MYTNVNEKVIIHQNWMKLLVLSSGSFKWISILWFMLSTLLLSSSLFKVDHNEPPNVSIYERRKEHEMRENFIIFNSTDFLTSSSFHCQSFVHLHSSFVREHFTIVKWVLSEMWDLSLVVTRQEKLPTFEGNVCKYMDSKILKVS